METIATLQNSIAKVLDNFGIEFQNEVSLVQRLRQPVEDRWIRALRQARAIYDPSEKVKMKGSTVYPKFTRSKEAPAVARVNSMALPSYDRNWDISPTPRPKLPDDEVRRIVQSLMKQDPQTGQIMPPSEQEVWSAIIVSAKESALLGRDIMDDQLTELKYPKIMKKAIKSGIRFGTGIIKGPLTKVIREVEVQQDSMGGYVQIEKETKKPDVSFVPVWYWYPDLSAFDIEDCGYTWELHCYSRAELRKVARRKDVRRDLVQKFIKSNPNGNYQLKYWESQLYELKDEDKSKVIAGKYELWERWGYIDGGLIKAAYEAANAELPEEFDENEDYWGTVLLLGNQIIKVALSHLPDDMATKEITQLYHLFYYDKDDTSIFGDGLPWTIEDSDATIAAATRAMLDNAARVAGPIFEINTDLLDDPDSADDIYPMRVFPRSGRGIEAQYPALRVYNIEARIQDYIAIIKLFTSFGDVESGVPDLMTGESATTQETARGASIRASSSSVTFGDIIKNFDDCNLSLIKALYAWNRNPNLNPDPSVKGDFEITAKGVNLTTKEMQTLALDNFATTLTSADEPYIKRGGLLRTRARAHSIDPEDFLRSDAEAEQIIQSQRDQEADALTKAQIAAEVRYTHGKAQVQEEKAAAVSKEVGIKAAKTISDIHKQKKQAGREK